MKFHKLPSIVPDMKIWKSNVQKYSFVITQETRMFEGFTGFTASWKNTDFDTIAFGKQPSNFIEGGPWKTFKEAEEACKKTFKQLRFKN